MLKRFCLLISAWCCFGALMPSVTEGVVDRVVAVVNEDIITLSEVEKRMGALKAEIEGGDRLEKKERVQEIRRKMLELLIDEKLLDLEAKKLRIKVSDKEVEAAVEEIKQKSGMSHEAFEKALSQEGLTLEDLKKEIERRMVRSRVIHFSVKVERRTDDEGLRRFYEEHIERYRSGESYRPSHILFHVSTEAPPEEVRGIRRKCEDVLNEIRKGADFGEMAFLYSQDVSATAKGDLGYFRKGELLPILEQEALRLRVGEVSSVVRSTIGFHIIKLLDRRGGAPLPFEEVKGQIQSEYYAQEMEKAVKRFVSSLREKSLIIIKL